MYRKTYVKIDSKKLTENIIEIKKKYSDYEYYFGVVKGNAYGHGDYIVNSLIDGGINYLAVSSLEEAVSIRKYNDNIPILCLEPISLEYIDVIIKNKVTITLDSLLYIKELCKIGIKDKIKVHIKLNTGMNRLGIDDREDLESGIEEIKKNSKLILEGIYTHLGTAGISDIYYDRQISKFEYLTKNVNLKDIPIVHLGRSMTMVNHKKLPYVNGIRLGICMYGFSNSIKEPVGIRKLKRKLMLKRLNISEAILENNLKLNTAFSLYTEVISLHNVCKGEFVGYGASYIAKEDIKVACLPIGYFDGMDKKMGYVVINHKRYEIIGDICMDMTMVKVDDTVKLHDKVEIFGDDISVKEVAGRIGSNVYRVLTGITNRVPRIYDDKEIKY